MLKKLIDTRTLKIKATSLISFHCKIVFVPSMQPPATQRDGKAVAVPAPAVRPPVPGAAAALPPHLVAPAVAPNNNLDNNTLVPLEMTSLLLSASSTTSKHQQNADLASASSTAFQALGIPATVHAAAFPPLGTAWKKADGTGNRVAASSSFHRQDPHMRYLLSVISGAGQDNLSSAATTIAAAAAAAAVAAPASAAHVHASTPSTLPQKRTAAVAATGTDLEGGGKTGKKIKLEAASPSSISHVVAGDKQVAEGKPGTGAGSPQTPRSRTKQWQQLQPECERNDILCLHDGKRLRVVLCGKRKVCMRVIMCRRCCRTGWCNTYFSLCLFLEGWLSAVQTNKQTWLLTSYNRFPALILRNPPSPLHPPLMVTSII